MLDDPDDEVPELDEDEPAVDESEVDEPESELCLTSDGPTPLSDPDRESVR